MEVKQISSTLNTVFQEVIGESAVVAEDLSNIVEVGRTITASTEWGNSFDNYVGKIIDKVGKVVFWDRVYTPSAPNILKDAWQYGSILEKIRVNYKDDAYDYEDNDDWNLLKGYDPSKIFEFSEPGVKAKYFNQKTTFRTKISITRKQAESAFRSASDMNRFISMIENAIYTKMAIATENLIMRTIVNLIGTKLANNANVVDLLAAYKTASGNTTVTAATALTDKEFLRFASKTIMLYKKYLSKPSGLYNNEGNVVFTPESELKLVILSDFAKAMETSLYADTFHNEFVKLEGYTEVPYWQGTGTDGEERGVIKATVAYTNATGGVDTKAIDTSAAGDNLTVVGVMFDNYAAAVCNEDPTTTSIYNPEADFYNYWFKADASYLNDTGENCVVFVIKNED